VPDDAVVRGYAEAVLQVAEAEGEVDAVVDQLYALAKLLERDARLREAVTDPALPVENKRALVADVLGTRANPNAVNVFTFLLEQGRAHEAGKIIQELADVAAERRQHQLAEVRSAVPLDEARRRRLADALSLATGKRIELRVLVDPSVVGGVVARVGDEIFDGTVRGRLEDARAKMTGANSRS
jgi:F-type H+-transporting ATPase subunit delta